MESITAEIYHGPIEEIWVEVNPRFSEMGLEEIYKHVYDIINEPCDNVWGSIWGHIYEIGTG